MLPQPTFQPWVNVVSTLWSDVENKTKSDVRFSTLHNVDTTSVPNVETTLQNVETTLHNVGTTLIQRCFNLASTLVKAILNPIGLVMIVDYEIVECMLNTRIVFLLLNEKIFYYILTIQLLMKYQTIF